MTKTIGIVLFPGFEDLDALGPKEVFGMFGGVSGGEWKCVLVSQDGGTITTSLGTKIVADHSFADSPPLDVVLVPGGLATRTEVDNEKLIDFVRTQGEKAAYVTSVCTGAFITHRAGFLAGKRATTHWGAINELRQLGDVTVVDNERWVQDGNVLSSAGVSAGIDMSLYLVSLLADVEAAKRVQQFMEYFPKPPVWEEVKA